MAEVELFSGVIDSVNDDQPASANCGGAYTSLDRVAQEVGTKSLTLQRLVDGTWSAADIRAVAEDESVLAVGDDLRRRIRIMLRHRVRVRGLTAAVASQDQGY